MNIFLSANEYTKEQQEERDLVIVSLKRQGFKLVSDIFSCDLAVSLGGDGALLRAAALALRDDKPIIGINAGMLGFLCALKLCDIEDFGKVLNDSFVSERLVLETSTSKGKLFAVNDIVFGKKYFGRPVDIYAAAGEKELLSFKGDGLIVSTPTGSTAYSKNAGGPVLEAGSSSFVLTPICAPAKPMILDEKENVTVSLKKGEWDIFIDGEKLDESCSKLSLQPSSKSLKLLLPKSRL